MGTVRHSPGAMNNQDQTPAPALGPGSRVALRLMGQPLAALDGGPLQALAPKDGLMLAMLALEGASPRDQLAALLWPSTTPAGARGNLRQRVMRLQTSFNQSLLVLQGSLLALRPGVSHDLADIESQLHADTQAVQGELLGPLVFDDAHAAQAWLRRARRGLHQRRQVAVTDLAK